MNPEFRRNTWLEINLNRLVAMPVGLFLIFAIVYWSNDSTLGRGVALTAVWSFIVIAVLWGTRLASVSVIEEVRERTWDTQLMSAMGPWSMTWGKLFGSTSYSWYGGLICLGVFAVAWPSHDELGTATLVPLAVFAAVFCQAMSMLICLLAVRQGINYRSSIGLFAMVLVLMFLIPMVREGLDVGESRVWYDTSYPAMSFALVSMGLAVFWALLGVYRLMSMALQVRTTPIAWLVFSLFLVVYIAGFNNDQTDYLDLWLHVLVIGFWVFLTLTYVAAFSDRRDPIALRRLVHAVQTGQWRRALEELPFWTVSADLSLIAGILVTAFALVGQSTSGFDPLSLCPSAFLLMLRDIGILYFFSLTTNPKRALMSVFFYLTLLYALIPLVLSPLQLTAIQMIVLPPMAKSVVLSTAIAAGHVVIVWWLVMRRWKTFFSMMQGKPSIID